MNAPHHPNVEKLLDGADWRLVREEEARRFNEAYERTQAQWHKLARNEREANIQMQSSRVYNKAHPFHTPFVRHEEVGQDLPSPARVLLGYVLFVTACVCIAVSVLYFWR